MCFCLRDASWVGLGVGLVKGWLTVGVGWVSG